MTDILSRLDEIQARADATALPRAIEALRVAVEGLEKNCAEWDRLFPARAGLSIWHQTLAAIEAALEGR